MYIYFNLGGGVGFILLPVKPMFLYNPQPPEVDMVLGGLDL
jgi:hypothetical protein